MHEVSFFNHISKTSLCANIKVTAAHSCEQIWILSASFPPAAILQPTSKPLNLLLYKIGEKGEFNRWMRFWTKEVLLESPKDMDTKPKM